MNALRIFENPSEQIEEMEVRLRGELNASVADEIIAFVNLRTNDKHNEIFTQLVQRVNRIEEIYETETESKSQYFERMHEFLEVTNPTELAGDLKKVLVFEEIENEYNKIINYFSEREFGKFYLRYQFDSKLFESLKSGILSDITFIKQSLSNYGEAVVAHINDMKSIKESSGGKTAFKVGTKIFGSLLAGPLGSIAGGAIANALTNDDGEISSSFRNVIEAWSKYLNAIDEFLSNLNTRYQHILLTLVGGLFLKVSRDIGKLEANISKLALLEYWVSYTITEKSLKANQKWMSKTIYGVQGFITNKEYKKALIASNELYKYVESHELLKYELFEEGKSFLYMANLYKTAAILSFARSIKDNEEKFDSIVIELFNTQPMLINDDHLKELNVPTQLEIAMHTVSKWINNGKLEQKGVIFPDLFIKSIERIKDTGYYDGEQLSEGLFTKFSISIGKFLCLEYEQENYERFVTEIGVDHNSLKNLIATYQKVTKVKKDKMVSFMRSMIISRSIWISIYYAKKPWFSIPAIILIIYFGLKLF